MNQKGFDFLKINTDKYINMILGKYSLLNEMKNSGKLTLRAEVLSSKADKKTGLDNKNSQSEEILSKSENSELKQIMETLEGINSVTPLLLRFKSFPNELGEKEKSILDFNIPYKKIHNSLTKGIESNAEIHKIQLIKKHQQSALNFKEFYEKVRDEFMIEELTYFQEIIGGGFIPNLDIHSNRINLSNDIGRIKTMQYIINVIENPKEFRVFNSKLTTLNTNKTTLIKWNSNTESLINLFGVFLKSNIISTTTENLTKFITNNFVDQNENELIYKDVNDEIRNITDLEDVNYAPVIIQIEKERMNFYHEPKIIGLNNELITPIVWIPLMNRLGTLFGELIKNHIITTSRENLIWVIIYNFEDRKGNRGKYTTIEDLLKKGKVGSKKIEALKEQLKELVEVLLPESFTQEYSATLKEKK